MKKIKILVHVLIGISIIGLSVFSVIPQERETESKIKSSDIDEAWKLFVPLKTYREDIERILGEPTYQFDNFSEYRFESGGRFDVWYSKGECRTIGSDNFVAPEGVLVGFLFYPLITTEARSVLAWFSEPLTREPSLTRSGGYSYFSKSGDVHIQTMETEEKGEFVLSVERRAGRKCDETGLLNRTKCGRSSETW